MQPMTSAMDKLRPNIWEAADDRGFVLRLDIIGLAANDKQSLSIKLAIAIAGD